MPQLEWYLFAFGGIKIHTQSEETRLNDYVIELNQWWQDRFKEPRHKWQDLEVLITGTNHSDDGITYAEFNRNFFVDDIKRENGRIGDRVSSQIYQEVLHYIKCCRTN